MKYLIWAVVVYFAWRWYLVSKQKSAAPDADAPFTAGASPDPTATASASAAVTGDGAAEKMIACAHCSIHLPLSEALIGADHRHYCSAEHRALHVAS